MTVVSPGQGDLEVGADNSLGVAGVRRVVFVNRFFFPDISATSQILSDLAFDLTTRGVTVQVVASRISYGDAQTKLPAKEAVCGVVVHRVWTSSFGRSASLGRAIDYLSFYLFSFFKLLSILRPGDVVVAKTDPPLICVAVAVACWLRRAKLVNWLQDLFPEVAAHLGVRLAQGRVGQLLASLRDSTLRFAAMNVAIGDVMARALSDRGIVDRRIVVIPNWADGEAIRPLAVELNPLREAWGLVGKFVVGYSGNLGRAHEFDTIIGAAEQLSNDKEVVFLFIGAGHAERRVKEEITVRGLTNVMFRSHQPRECLGQSLTLPDVHVVSLLPALEGCIVPSKFFGAIAAGRPVIFVGSPDGEIALELARGGAGTTIAAGDVLAFANTVRAWVAAPLLVEEMGRNARVAFDSSFCRSMAVERWLDVFRRL